MFRHKFSNVNCVLQFADNMAIKFITFRERRKYTKCFWNRYITRAFYFSHHTIKAFFAYFYWSWWDLPRLRECLKLRMMLFLVWIISMCVWFKNHNHMPELLSQLHICKYYMFLRLKNTCMSFFYFIYG